MFIQIQKYMSNYEERCKKNKESIMKRYEKKDNERIQTNTNVNDCIQTYTNENECIPNKNKNKNKNKNMNKNNDIGDIATKRFVAPSQNEVIDYMFEIIGDYETARSEGERFFDFYSSKGWMVGKSSMKDWKASARNWHRKQESFEQPVITRMNQPKGDAISDMISGVFEI